MGLGAFATIGVQGPENLTVVVLDNGCYGETGMQPSHTSLGADLVQIARGCGFPHAETVTTTRQVHSLHEVIHRRPGPNLGVVKVVAEKHLLVLPPREGVLLKNRFRKALSDS
jgi:thiamine pyrophosphate-dependent acetolactate synthase large subunit-like protein